MELKSIMIPAGLTFADLGLEREPRTKRLLYKPVVLAQLVDANDLGAQTLFTDEDLAAWLIIEWYVVHLNAGGKPDPVAEEIQKEVADTQASGISALQPGGDQAH